MGLLLSVGTMSSTSFAQTSGMSKPPVDENAQAARIYITGVRAAKVGQWQEAYEAYRSAWSLKQHFQIAANLGRAELKLGKHRDAAEHLAFFLREAQGVSESERAMAQQMLGEAKAKVATLEVVVVRRERAEVLVDGVPVGTAPLGHEVYVEPGVRSIEARLQGEAPAKVSVELAAGASRRVELGLEEPAAAVARPTQTSLRAPSPPRPVPAQGHPGSGGSKALVIGGVAATAVAAGLGVGLAVASQSKATELHRLVPTECEDPTRCEGLDLDRYNRLAHTADMLANGSFWGFVAAGALGVGTLGIVLLKPDQKTHGSVDAGVSVAAGPAGITIMKRW